MWVFHRQEGNSLPVFNDDIAAQIARTRWVTASSQSAPTALEKVLVKASDWRMFSVSHIFGICLTLSLAAASYLQLPAEDQPVLVASIWIAGAAFIVLFCLYVRTTAISRMIQIGDEIRCKTLSRPNHWQEFQVTDVLGVEYRKAWASPYGGSPETVIIRLRGRRRPFIVYPNFNQDNCDMPGLFALTVGRPQS